MTNPAYDVLDDALSLLSPYGPELRNGFTTHAPMVAEALCAVGRPDAVMPWLEARRAEMQPPPPAHARIEPARWRDALAQPHRFADWSRLFAEELEEGPWRAVLARWVARLAPGLCAAATHGVIRVGHAARGLADRETPLRRRELADALASWTSTYQELPTPDRVGDGTLRPAEALAKVAIVPPERRRFTGTIVSSLEGLSDFPEFASVIGLVDVGGDPSARVAELAELFARVHLENAHDPLTTIVFVHGVTSVAALGNLLPYVDEATARAALRFAWQAGCGLYATFGRRPPPARAIAPPDEDWETLVDRAIAEGDEHGIKLAEAGRHADALAPSPAYRAAARHAIEHLSRH